MKSLRMVTLTIICSIFLAAMNSPVFAEQKIGYLDLSKVFDSYDKTKELDAALESEHKAYEQERTEKIEKLKEAQGKLALLKEEEKAKVEQEVEQMRNDLLAYDQAQRTDLTKQRDERIREVLLEIEKVVSDFAKKEKYDLILNDRVLIYGSDPMNISEQILKILNESYNKK